MDRTEVKKLARFANAIHEVALANSSSDENPLAEFIDGTARRLDRIRNRSRFLSRVPNIRSPLALDGADEIYYDFRFLRDICHSYTNSGSARILEMFSAREQKPNHRMILKGIMCLAENNEFEMDLNKKAQSLIIPLPEFMLEDEHGEEHCFNELSIQFSLNGDERLHVTVLGPEDEDHDTDCPHPHVSSSGRICWGQPASEQVENLLDKGLIESVYHTAVTILSQYNPASPFYPLARGESCAECGVSIPRDEEYCCDHCGRIFCGDCYTSCYCGNTSGCVGCLDETCYECGQRICHLSRCSNLCAECGERFCVECLEDLDDDWYCTNCIDAVRNRKREEEDEEEEDETDED